MFLVDRGLSLSFAGGDDIAGVISLAMDGKLLQTINRNVIYGLSN
jgi:hypothetical protein